MAQPRTSIHGNWSSRWAFILAATGAAVGLGNIWKFPYITGENGGGAFVVIYLMAIAMIGVPLLMAEILIGRRGRRNPVNSMYLMAQESKKHPAWQAVGWLMVCAGFLILSYYSVIAGWSLEYVWLAIIGAFNNAGTQEIQVLFDSMLASPQKLLFLHSLIMSSTIIIVAAGVQKGLERSIYLMFPTMLVLLVILVVYAMQSGHFKEGLAFLFQPDFNKLTSSGTLIALGHAFFTLSLATGSIMMYGAYLPNHASVAKGAIAIAFADTLVAILAGLAIFPLVFANQLEANAGPGLIFQTLPLAFAHMPYGQLVSILFFAMLVFAALTSAISLLEPTVALLMERLNLSRQRAALLSGSLLWVLGLGSIFSFNLWANKTVFDKTFFDLLDYVTANIMLPMGGLFLAIFAAWKMEPGEILNELRQGPNRGYYCWRFCVRYVAPVAITIIFLDFIGMIDL